MTNPYQFITETFTMWLSPPFMKDIFDHNGNGRATRMGDKFARPMVNKVYTGENSLRSFGPIVWNTMLPNKFKGCSSLAEIKNSTSHGFPIIALT